MRLLILSFLFLNVLKGLSQVSIDSISYKNDLAIYRKALEETHPGLYRFSNKEKFDSLFSLIESKLDSATTEMDFFRSISKITSLIRESHSYVQPPASLSSGIRNKFLFPFEVLVKDSSLIIKNSRSKELKYLKNATVYAINGRCIKSILQTLSETTCTVSAFNDSGLKSRLSLYENFALAYYYFIDTTSSFQISYKTKSATKATSLTIKGWSNELRSLTFPELPPEADPPFELNIDKKNATATIRISTFAYWIVGKQIKDYSKFFKESFDALQKQKIQHLIIDVRGNRGGEEMLAGELLTYLIDSEFTIYKYCKANSLEFDFINALPHSNQIKLSRANYITTDSGFVMKKANFLKSYSPQKSQFEGDVYVLANGMCASACNIFLALIKTHKVGKIIGQESGGAFEDVDGRHRIKFLLPYSKIFVSYPVWAMKLNTSGGNKRRGVVPDYEVFPTIDDITFEIDVSMERVFKLINGAR